MRDIPKMMLKTASKTISVS